MRFVTIANKFDAILDLKKKVLSETTQKNNSSFDEVILLHEELVEVVEEVIEAYGGDIILELEFLVESGADEPEVSRPSGSGGSGEKCCELTDHNTVDWSCCNWWETVVAGVRAGLSCTSPLEQPGADAGVYYECLQRQICKSC